VRNAFGRGCFQTGIIDRHIRTEADSRNALGAVYWRQYIDGGILAAVYSVFESWQVATIVICMRLSCLFPTVRLSTATVILSSLSLLK
jgi:lipid-A-disaccharide synthase-like uncharacterized protein